MWGNLHLCSSAHGSKNACVDIVVSGHSIKWEMSARYLGVYFDSSTNFKCSFSKKQRGIFKSLLIVYLGKLAGAHQKRCCSS